MRDPRALEGQIVSEREAIVGGKTEVELWLEKINAARAEERDWRESAAKASDVYEASKDQNSHFNIYHANVEVTIPAIYNSTPIPDVRRRHEPEQVDPAKFQGMLPEQAQIAMQQAQQQAAAVGKVHNDIAEMVERGLGYSVDQYDFDDVIEEATRDLCVTGRGVVRLRYLPTMNGEELVDEEMRCELVPWDRFIRGPGIGWHAVPFIAFEHDLTKDQIEGLIDKPERLAELGFSAPRLDGTDFGDEKENDLKHKGILKTVKVFEIWDKPSRTVLFITPELKSAPLNVIDDELGLNDFFCVPKPIQTVRRTRSMVPVCPYDVYAPLIDEIDRISRRIKNLIDQCKVKGGYDPKMAPDFELLRDADDGTYVPITASEEFAPDRKGGLDAAVMHWPIDQIVKVIQALYQEREQVKMTIYEVMGLADIMRGSVDPNEKLGQSEIKAESGARRMKRAQKEVARLARDLFRMKGQVMLTKFAPETLYDMTGITLTQQHMQAMQGAAKTYAIDIETDSTVRADMARYQEELNTFLAGTAQIASAATAMAPVMPKTVGPMMKVYASFARKFNLGKQGEDALEELSTASEEPPQQPDDGSAAAQQQAQMQMEADAQAREADMQMKREEMDMKREEAATKADLEMRKMDREDQRAEVELQIKQLEIELKMMDIEAKREDMRIRAETARMDLQVKHAEIGMKEREAEIKHESMEREAEHGERMSEMDMQGAEMSMEQKREAHEQNLEMKREQSQTNGAADRG